MSKYPQALVSATWLLDHIADDTIRIFDATYHMPAAQRNASVEFTQKHIPYARFFDIDAIADTSSDQAHMLPPPEDFSRAVGAMGMSNDHFAVVYDVHGLMSAARLWWMFRVFGHDRVAVLDGGLPAWIAAGGSVESGSGEPSRPAVFHARFRPELVRNKADMLAALQEPSIRIIDARNAARFRAEAPEPRPGVRQGHIPGSASVPYTELLDDKGRFLPQPELQQRFVSAGIGENSQVICSCGSGVTACVLALGLTLTGIADVPVYDGSWNEWGADESCPIEIGAAA